MKFIVEKDRFNNEVEVKLHKESKRKIYWGLYFGALAAYTAKSFLDAHNRQDGQNTPEK